MAIEKRLTPILPEDEDIPPVPVPELDDVSAGLDGAIGEAEVIVLADGEELPEPEPDEPVPFDANLAELVDEGDLREIAQDLQAKIDQDMRSRDDWWQRYKKGLNLLGLKVEEVTEPWPGAAGMFHPVLMEGVIRFQASAITEMFPAKGPVRTKIVGKSSDDVMKQARRIETDMNYQITERMPGYRDETDTMLLKLPLAGSAFKKVKPDAKGRCQSIFVAAEDIIVPNGCLSLEESPRVTHRYREFPNEVKKRMFSGEFREIDLSEPTAEYSEVAEAEGEQAGETIVEDERHTIYEVHTVLDLPGFEENVKVPYIVTFEKQSNEVLSIYRNYREDDDEYEPYRYFAHYKYLPGFGFYGTGLIHLVAGLAEAVTLILRQLVDAGTLSNLRGGFKTKEFRANKGDNSPIRPGEFRDVDVAGGVLRDNILPLPFGEPSAVLYQLMKDLVDEARNLAAVPDLKISDMNSEAPVGTALAIIERSMKVLSAVQGRIHDAFGKEVRMIADIIRDYYPPEYEFELGDDEQGATRTEDYDGRVDVLPVTNPNAATMAQRVMKAQAALQLQQSAPTIYDERRLHRDMLEAIGYENAEDLVPLEKEMVPSDPLTENMAIMAMDPVKAHLHQNHDAHIQVHMNMLQDPMIAQVLAAAPQAKALESAIMSHVQEHLGMKYRSMIEQTMGVELPHPDEPLPPDVEVEMSAMVAQASAQLLQQNRAVVAKQQALQKAQDPVIQMQERELALKERKEQRQSAESTRRLDLQEIRDLRDAMLGKDEVAARVIDSILDAFGRNEELTVRQAIEGLKAGIAHAGKMTSDNP